ncbi:MAG: nickel pincer cofactor biosynthesis protein LarC [Candidatus Omnitrophota bacterium]|nr:nickel pincer cofactor biosynthesis protein LarC [Candidatus Omnitrophota bacterium]
MKIAYFDCFSGIAGDMALGAFVDAGLDIKILSRELKKLKIKGYELKAKSCMRGELSGTKLDVVIKRASGIHTHRSFVEILKLIDDSSLDPQVKANAKKIFNIIGAAESKIHGIGDKKKLHLHELGDIDSIIDIVGTAIAIDALGIDEIYSSGVNLGRTLLHTKAGVLPAPGPATLEILKGVGVKVSGIDSELVTPTGAGILKALCRGFGDMPEMKVSDIGYGAGTNELSEIPNMLRIIIGDRKGAFEEDRIFVIETNIDDMNPQNFEYLFEKLLKDGALDAYTTIIQMKKSRAAFKLTVLSDRSKLERLCSVIFSETTSIGIRYYEADRFKLRREIVKVSTKYGNIKVKLSTGPDNILTVSPEYEECVKIARAKDVPLKKVYEEAKREAIGRLS